MPWQKTSFSTPIPKTIEPALAPVHALISDLGGVLGAISTLLDAAKIFVVGTTDPFAALAATAITSLETLINDLFATGVYNISVSPFEIEGGRKYDTATGLPIFSAGECINTLIASFYDEGDINRPQFSNSADVVAFGILVTAPTPQQFLDILNNMERVFEWPTLHFPAKVKVDRYVNTSQLSTNPDWKSLRLNSFGIMSDIQHELVRMLKILSGYIVTADSFLLDLIAQIQRKVDVLQEQLDALDNLLNSLQNISGVYFFDCPPGVGGNSRITRLLRDPVLQDPCVVTGFTAATLFVGGGPSYIPVNTMREAFGV